MSNYSHDGLRLKHQKAIAGGTAHQGTYALGHDIQRILGGQLKYFTAFNDDYHHSEAYFKKKGKRDPGLHGAGLAIDVAITNPRESAAAANKVRQLLIARGLRPDVDFKVIDEYARPSSGATGGHLDIRFLNNAAAQKYLGGNAVTAPITTQSDSMVLGAASVTPPQMVPPQFAPQMAFTAPTDFTAQLEKEAQAAYQQLEAVSKYPRINTTRESFFEPVTVDWSAYYGKRR